MSGFLVCLLISLALVPSLSARSHGGGSRSGGWHSRGGSAQAPRSHGGEKTVHVKAYTRKDGTRVKAHDRKAPGEAEPSRAERKRSANAKADFERQSGYPHGRPGYVVDHIVPLACGGLDAPSNMQWQTVADAKAKDKTERKGC